MRTVADIQAAFYAVLKTDAAGAALRAQLTAYGASAASIITKDALIASALPAAPFLVLAWGPESGGRTDVQRHTPTWWLYDTMGHRWARLNTLLPLVRAAYPKTALTSCEIDFLANSGELTDATLNCRAKSQPMTILTR